MSFRSSAGRRRLLGASSAAALLTAPAIVGIPAIASAQTVTELPPVTVQSTPLSAQQPFQTIVGGDALAGRQSATGDAASLLDGVPGVNLQAGGGVSSLPSLHGLADDRLLNLLDGVQTTAACPNHMNPPLSYAEPATVDKAAVYSGISPVSMGGDNIGGVVALKTKPPLFAGPGQGILTSGQMSAYFKSNASNVGSSVQGTMAGENVSLGVTGGWNRAADYTSGNGATVYSTSYENMDYSVTAAAQKDGHTFVFKGGQQFIPYENFANQPMDMIGNHQAFMNGHYTGEFGWGTMDALGFWNHVSHKMDDVTTDKHVTSMPMPMYTDGIDTGYAIKAELPLSQRDTLRVGNELHLQTLNDWWPATMSGGGMGPNTFTDIQNGRRDRFGTFGEWEAKWNPAWTTVAGLRNDIVWSDADHVQSYHDSMAMYASDVAAFNAKPHSQIDYNVDGTLLTRFEPDQVSTYEAGLARKTRSPSLFERYTWSTAAMTANMIGWFGDGNGYVGNPDLRPESAHTASVSAGWHDAARTDWEVKATPYFTYVHNYINVDYVGPNTYSGNGSILRFANHDAELYGADLSGRKTLAEDDTWGKFGLGGTVGWVRGYQVNNGNSLYHLMPLNTKLTLDHKLGGWSSAIDLKMVDDKSEADPLRQEPTTPGYVVADLRTAYDWKSVRLDLGIDNLFNRQYYNPLGGIALGDFYNSGGKGSGYAPLAAMGRSFNAGVTVKF